MTELLTARNYHRICDRLADMEPIFQTVIDAYGYPPLWSRPNTFESFVHIILEQQVSLASALATLEKLRARLDAITPELVLTLDDAEMKACYVSRQKAGYIRCLAEAIRTKGLVLADLEVMDDDEVHTRLLQLKGIGNWTVDIYLIFVLHRPDVFPIGDLAARNALKQLWRLPKDTSTDALLSMTAAWRPHRTVATMLLWHHYLSSRARNQ